MATCILEESKLENKFWGHAILYANKIRNRVPSRTLNNKTPFTLFFGKEPNLQHYQKFGCFAYNQVPKHYRQKFDSHIKNCIYLGLIMIMVSIIYSILRQKDN